MQKILIIDDVLRDRVALQELLQKHGYTSETCGSKAASMRLSEERYDVIFTAVTMNHLDGAGVATFVRKALPSPDNEIPIVAVGAIDDALCESVLERMKLFINAKIDKPFDEEQIIAKVSEFIF